MKDLNTLNLVVVAIVTSMGAFNTWAISPRASEIRSLESLESASPRLVDDNEEWYFSRFAIQLAPFAEMDLELIELKIQPYVELRFDRKQPK